MATSVIYADGASGDITSSNATYLTARTGSNLVSSPAATVAGTGQFPPGAVYDAYEAFLAFDTSTIVAPVTAVVFDWMLISSANAIDNYTTECRTYDWGTAITTADWVAGASISGNTLLASISSSGIGANDVYKTFTSEAAFTSAINTSGFTRFMAASDKLRTGTAPTNNESLSFYLSAFDGGTSTDPKLTITAAEPPPARSITRAYAMMPRLR